MDYTTQSISLKIKKAVRYTRIYGIRRTLIKIKSQYHVQKTYETLPSISELSNHYGRIGVIGCGSYAFSNIAYYLDRIATGAIRGCMDTDVNKAVSLYQHFGLQYYTTDADELIADPDINLVFIASNHASHAEYAIACLRAGKSIHIEKPHVVNHDQLERLSQAMTERPDLNVYLGFNRPRSKLFLKLQKLLDVQRGPLMINWFVAGHEIAQDHWYYDDAEGGRVLGNLCHWTDLTLHLVGLDNAFPCTIVPATRPNAHSDYVVSILFADKSSATISFSAFGNTFEGVREILSVHKGDLLANLVDFQKLSVDVAEKRFKFSSFFRDHGHFANIRNSYQSTFGSSGRGEKPDYVRKTALFFLAIKNAIDTGNTVTLERL